MNLSKLLIISIFLSFLSETCSAQIPSNPDSAKAIYDRMLSDLNSHPHPNMQFNVEVDGKNLRHQRHHFGYIRPDGVKEYFPLNRKLELGKLPQFKEDTVILFYRHNKLEISSKRLKTANVSKGGSVFFGIIHDFDKEVAKFDNDGGDYRTDLANHHRGFFAIVSSDYMRECLVNARRPFTLYYFVLQRGGSQTVTFYYQ